MTARSQAVETVVREVLIAHLGARAEGIQGDYDLAQLRQYSSFMRVRVLEDIEERLAIEVPTDLLLAVNMTSLENLIRMFEQAQERSNA